MKSAGDLISASAELSSRMQLCKDQVYRVSSCFVIDTDGDAAPVIRYRDRIVRLDDHSDLCTETCQRLIHGIVHDLVDQMVESPGCRRPDIHAGTLADSLKALKDLDIIRRIFPYLRRILDIVIRIFFIDHICFHDVLILFC